MRRAALALALSALVTSSPRALAQEKAAPPSDVAAPPSNAAAPPSNAAAPPSNAAAPAPAASWCAPELTTLPGDVCAFTPTKEAPGPRTLVIYLHGVILPDSGWQWAQQRGAARAGARHGFTVLMPRGRRGIGPRTMEDWWAWPTAVTAQKGNEDSIVAEWDAARAELERRAGQRFERVLVFGFSNGAYYATSLALRGRLPVQGYAAFAGGAGAKYLERAAAKVKPRAPLFVAWGGKDKAHRDQVGLARMLKRIGWPTESMGSKRAGHAMTDAQVEAAVRFLGKPARR